MQISALIATRGDRPQFVEHLREVILPSQTRPFDEVIWVDYDPITSRNDHKQRLITGINQATGDYIAFIEDDDYYQPDYLERMGELLKGSPEMVGCSWTLYYHLKSGGTKHMNHPNRSSLFTTLIRTDYAKRIRWHRVEAIDMSLWAGVKDFKLTPHIHAIGIKHGIGKQGGIWHDESNYIAFDQDMRGLRGMVTSESYEFYQSLKQ